MVPLADTIGDHPRIDLLHIDIQGGEAELARSNLERIGKAVAHLLIGRHSKPIEGDLYDMLPWRMEMERPAISEIRVDGVQGWRNPVLLPP